jgi:hypothetical protein
MAFPSNASRPHTWWIGCGFAEPGDRTRFTTGRAAGGRSPVRTWLARRLLYELSGRGRRQQAALASAVTERAGSGEASPAPLAGAPNPGLVACKRKGVCRLPPEGRRVSATSSSPSAAARPARCTLSRPPRRAHRPPRARDGSAPLPQSVPYDASARSSLTAPHCLKKNGRSRPIRAISLYLPYGSGILGPETNSH